MQEIINRLDSLAKKVSLVERADIEDINEIFDIYETIISLHVTQLSSLSSRIISTLFHIFECLSAPAIDNINGSDDIKKKIIDTINNLSALYQKLDPGEKALVYFLNILNERKKLYEERDILKDYNEYVDRLEPLSWLFRIEYKGELAYPIGDLLSSSILDEFVPDEEHLLYLIASLQLFANLRQIPDEARETILKYSKQYNLKILELLCNQGTVLFGSDRKKNMEQNRVIVVRKDTTVLVRTTDLSREEDPNHPYDYETNVNNECIAKFFTFDLKPCEKLCSLDEFLEKGSADECRKLIIKAINDGAYNIFMDDSIVYDAGSRCFVDWINPIVSQDKVIISDVMGDTSAQGNSERAFFFTLDRHRSKNWCRPAVLVQNGIDVLTLDFLISFCSSVSESLQITAISFVPTAFENWEKDRTDFAQNYIIRQFFERVLSSRKNITRAMAAYSSFIDDHYISSGDITTSTRLVMPYAFYMPFQTYSELLFAFLSVQNPIKDSFSYVDVEHTREGQWLLNNEVVERPILDIVTQERVVPRHMTSAKYKGLYNAETGNIYALASTVDKPVVNAFDKLSAILKKSVISQEDAANIRALPIDNLYEIIYNIGLSNSITEFFWPVSDPTRLTMDQQLPLLLYKILHHICFYEMQDKLDQWKELIFKCHLIETSKRDAPMYESFKGEIHNISLQDNCLLVSKQQHADKSTLEAILDSQRGRDIVDIAFDSQALNDRIEMAGKKYRFKSKAGPSCEIKRIIFLTDNIISGTSTKKMLQFHLDGQPESKESVKRGYIVLKPGKTIQEIINTNSPRVEIHTAFWFSTIADLEIKVAEDQTPYFEISLSNGQTIPVYVYARQTYPKATCVYTQHAFDLAMSLYARKSSDAYSNSTTLVFKGDEEQRHLLFRFNNMPSFYVFPEEVMDTQKKVGLFDHRKENV